MRILSVDLGTSNTAAVLSAHGRPPRVIEVDGSATLPSSVFADEDGNLMVGRDAERRARLDPARFEPNPKRRVDEGNLLLGDRVVPVAEALSAVLRRVSEETSRQLGGAVPDEVRLSHPAQWGPVRRNVLLSAARQAGFGSNLVLVPEPVAAAAHYAALSGYSLAPGQSLAVYDLGAGTFDVAVVGATQQGFAVLAEGGLPDLGGLDVDQALLEHVGRQVSFRDPQRWQRLLRPESTADRRAQRALREDVKEAKESLSRHPQTEVPMPEPFDDVLVTRAELEALVRPSLLRSVELLASTVRSTGTTPDQLAGIYLVGGSSRIPLVASLIGEQLGVVPTSLDQPETAVALGAHHVSEEGLRMRTHDLGGVVGGAAAASQLGQTGQPSQASQPTGVGPSSGGLPSQAQPGQAQPGQAQPGQRPAGPPPAAGGPQNPGYRPAAAGPNNPAPVRGGYPAGSGTAQLPKSAKNAKNSSKNRALLIGGIAAAVLLLGGLAAFIFLRGDDSQPSAEECQQPGETDDVGFTNCMRQLAGSIADQGDCSSGLNAGGYEMGSIGGPMVSCKIPEVEGASLIYYHAPSQAQADTSMNVMDQITGAQGNAVEANWQGNGLAGRYRSTAGPSIAVLTFTVNDRPVYGTIIKPNLGGGSTDPNDLADVFEKNVVPESTE
ncbi:Hsp70 protein [Tamaricihabitans halophyticus]|uniref:Hsp70 protein n=1 Tax=Tamaricihabitans halophyticus TaxID=1262583 RepID=A0A4R2R0D5_9PSEU|nr:Hsp70 family protein [Tamaricihabitans halophyticus]TCP55154.1 Hsp70 protein [Tamaricihabitans halophyticus]